MGDAEGEHEAAAFIDGTGLCVAVNLSPRYGPHAPIQGQLTHITPPGQTLTAPTRNLAFFVHLCLSTLEIRPGTRPATSGQFQFSGPNWPRVTPGDSPGHFPTPGGRFEDQFGSVQANFGPNSSPAGSNSSPTGFNSSPAGSKSSPAGSFETRAWSLSLA